MRLIDADKLEHEIRKSMNERYISWTKTIKVADISTLIFDTIDSAPTVERQQGKWLHPYKSDIACECSNCHRQMPITNYYHFCPNCGVKMKKEAENENV